MERLFAGLRSKPPWSGIALPSIAVCRVQNSQVRISFRCPTSWNAAPAERTSLGFLCGYTQVHRADGTRPDTQTTSAKAHIIKKRRGSIDNRLFVLTREGLRV